MNYLTDLPEYLNQHGLSKVLLVRSETIHLKHILTVLQQSLAIDDLHTFMSEFTYQFRKLYNISRDYDYPIHSILDCHRNKFDEMYDMLRFFNPIIYIDENLSYHVKNNLSEKYENTIVVNLDMIKNYDVFKFVIADPSYDLSEKWLQNYKTFHYRNKRIKNFTLYDKQ